LRIDSGEAAMDGSTLVLIFLGVFALAIVQAVVRRKRNPYGEIAYSELDAALRAEIERIVPDFQPGTVRITKHRDEVRIAGQVRSESARVEAELDAQGALVELEFDLAGGSLQREVVSGEPSGAVSAEIDRVLGDARSQFERRVMSRGTAGGEAAYQVKGTAAGWKWEIEVSDSGRLLEVEMEKRRH
jgi:hypothetical protein